MLSYRSFHGGWLENTAGWRASLCLAGYDSSLFFILLVVYSHADKTMVVSSRCVGGSMSFHKTENR